MSLVPFLTHLVAPWARLYNDSKLVYTTVTFAHVGGILFGGGCAIAADRMTLGLRTADEEARRVRLADLHAVHRAVLIGLTITFASGFLQLAADLETFLGSAIFWIKMGLVLGLLLNGVLLQRIETRIRAGTAQPDRAWRRLRTAAWISLALWFGATLFGSALLAV